MTNKKNAFFTFCFSLIPGAGEMYLGFYRMGGSIMFLTMVTLALSESLFPPMGYLLPIFWFYSLFHTHNLNHLPDEEFYAVEDAYLFHLQPDALLRGDWLKQYRRPTAALLVIFGAAIAWNAVWNVIRTFLFQFAVSDAVIEMASDPQKKRGADSCSPLSGRPAGRRPSGRYGFAFRLINSVRILEYTNFWLLYSP